MTDNPGVLRETTIHFGQYGMLVPMLEDSGKLALQAMDWAHEKVGRRGTLCCMGAQSLAVSVQVRRWLLCL